MPKQSSKLENEEAVGSRRASRKRGTSYPTASLLETAQILKSAAKYGFEHHIDSFADYMGHSTTNSGAFRQRLAAFRDWGLIEGRGDTLTMTNVARVIALPPDAASEREALQQAFKNCAVFAGLYEKMAKGQPLDRDGLAAQAVHSCGVLPPKANRFVRSFVDSLVAAQLAEVDEQGHVVLLEHGSTDGADQTVPEREVVDTALSEAPDPSTLPRSVGSQPLTEQAPTIRQSWGFADGEITLEVRSVRALPATAFAAIGDVVTKLEGLAASLSEPEYLGAGDEGGEA